MVIRGILVLKYWYKYKCKYKYKYKWKYKYKYKYKYKCKYQFEWWSCSVLESPPATGRSRPTVPTFIKQRSASMTTYQTNFAYKDYFGKISQPEGLLGFKTEQGNFFTKIFLIQLFWISGQYSPVTIREKRIFLLLDFYLGYPEFGKNGSNKSFIKPWKYTHKELLRLSGESETQSHASQISFNPFRPNRESTRDLHFSIFYQWLYKFTFKECIIFF